MPETKAERREIKKRPRMHMHSRGLRSVLQLWQKDAEKGKTGKKKQKKT